MRIKRAFYFSLLCSTLLVLLSACTAASPAAPKITNLPDPLPTISRTLPAPPAATPTAAVPAPTATNPPPTALPPTETPTEPAAMDNLYAVVGVAPDDVLQLRKAPGATSAILGTIPAGSTGIMAIAPAKKIEGELWAPVVYQGLAGWVNASFLAKQSGTPPTGLANAAAQAMHLLKQRDFIHLATLLPTEGLRFSPYTSVRPEDLTFNPLQVANLADDAKVYHWGIFDGSGKPIDLAFRDYYKRFIYDVNFAQPDEIGFNASLGKGNMINNIAEFYPGAAVVEYHFPGFDPNYDGLDWRSLRLVFALHDQKWALIGIVHDQWSP